MIKLKKVILFIMFYNFFFVLHATALNNSIVFKINNSIITQIDVEQELAYLKTLDQKVKDIGKKRALEISLNSLIREKVKEIELKKFFSLEQDDKYLEKVIEGYSRRIGYKNLNEFKDYLKENNLKISSIKKKFNIEYHWNELIYRKYSNQIKIDEKKLKEQLNKFIKKNQLRKKYLISEILIQFENNNAMNDKINLIKKSILEIGFSATANNYSISSTASTGGKLGWINDSQLSKEIRDKVEILKIGDYTEPFNVDMGILILKVEDVKKEEIKLDFNKEMQNLIRYENNNQLSKFSNIYFNKIKKSMQLNEY